MRVLVTGATGFVGRWLVRELETSGHEAIATGDATRLDVRDRAAVRRAIGAIRPDAIAHLAGVAYGPDADRDPNEAFGVNVGGTINVLEAVRDLDPRPVILVTGSSDVYGSPAPGDLPLTEAAPIAPERSYGLSKAAQEAVALEIGEALGVRVIVTRAFNHTGPGQRTDFAVPAFASRILAAKAAGRSSIRVGNVDVRRDLSDVRDVVRAYRLLLEVAERGGTPGGLVVNVATGTPTAIRSVIERLAAVAGWEIAFESDPGLIRANDPAVICGDATRLRELTGWRPEIPLDRTLADVLDALSPVPR